MPCRNSNGVCNSCSSCGAGSRSGGCSTCNTASRVVFARENTVVPGCSNCAQVNTAGSFGAYRMLSGSRPDCYGCSRSVPYCCAGGSAYNAGGVGCCNTCGNAYNTGGVGCCNTCGNTYNTGGCGCNTCGVTDISGYAPNTSPYYTGLCPPAVVAKPGVCVCSTPCPWANGVSAVNTDVCGCAGTVPASTTGCGCAGTTPASTTSCGCAGTVPASTTSCGCNGTSAVDIQAVPSTTCVQCGSCALTCSGSNG